MHTFNNGVTVQADLDFAIVPHAKPYGILTDKILMDPKTGIHYCAECGRVGPEYKNVMPHLNAHRTGPSRRVQRQQHAAEKQRKKASDTWVPATIPNGSGAGSVTDSVLYNARRELYKCADCDYTNKKCMGAVAHRTVHFPRGAQALPRSPEAPTPRVAPTLETQVEEVVQRMLAEQAQTLAAPNVPVKVAEPKDASHWKLRALNAEKKLQEAEKTLQQLRAALGVQ